MLVLSRQRDETICIGNSVTVTVVDIRGDKVRLGVNAPRTIPVHREEVAARLPPVMSDDDVHQAVLAACVPSPFDRGTVRPRLPDVPLARMLEVNENRPGLDLTCNPRLIAAVYAIQQWGGVEPMLAALGYDVSMTAAGE